MKWLDKLERKFGKIYIPNLMLTVIGLSAVVYIITFVILGNLGYINKLILYPGYVMNGEIWRLVTFLFIPPLSGNILIVAITFYFQYFIGVTLEREWGEFKFNVYFFVGAICTIIVSFLTNMPATGSAITLSLFLAFAKLFPEYTILLFFILPIRMKWLGYLAWATIALECLKSLLSGNILGIIFALVPVLNYILFFGVSNYRDTKMRSKSVIRMSDYRRDLKKAEKRGYRHKCTVCGITDADDKNMLFRYCSKCKGNHAYCEKHIHDHEHIE